MIEAAVQESAHTAMRASEYYLSQGEDVFHFTGREGRHFIITREMNVEAWYERDKFLAYTSARFKAVATAPWHPGASRVQ